MDEKHKLLGNFEKILKFFDENSIEKLNFVFLFFRQFVTKNRAFEIRPFFYNIFSVWGVSPLSPLATPLPQRETEMYTENLLKETKENLIIGIIFGLNPLSSFKLEVGMRW